MRKTNLARLLARRIDGIFLSDFETGEIRSGPVPPRLPDGVEGMVSKHRDSTYRGGKFRHWIVGNWGAGQAHFYRNARDCFA